MTATPQCLHSQSEGSIHGPSCFTESCVIVTSAWSLRKTFKIITPSYTHVNRKGTKKLNILNLNIFLKEVHWLPTIQTSLTNNRMIDVIITSTQKSLFKDNSFFLNNRIFNKKALKYFQSKGLEIIWATQTFLTFRDYRRFNPLTYSYIIYNGKMTDDAQEQTLN